MDVDIVGHFRIGVVRADEVQRQEQEDQEIGNARQRELSVGRSEHAHENHHQGILQQPVLAVVRRDRPERELDGQQCG
jgi:hypothetical protein